jgi:hypothetical protein
MLRKVENNIMRSEWMMILECITISSILWIYCPDHAGVRSNEEADKLQDGHRLMESSVCTGKTFCKGLLISSKRLRMKIITTMCIYKE